ncbi:transposase [Jannaschia sp. Os4]|uniref:REP-associated tyrosine transposase n=1 Tax=Jannaschia sp. Os4 TaxID=2807617 RepID=UPI0019394EAB|nr:transposase [Jannaschia sp. Os4]MBM2575196.1 transposase [Jannaschia sp. Os4]
MTAYRRLRVPGGTYFFTLALERRGASTLVDHIDLLRAAWAATARERPFVTEAVVVLPDHLHAVWRLPEGDVDFSTRWGAIKARFTRGVRARVEGMGGDEDGVEPHPTGARGGTRRMGFHPIMDIPNPRAIPFRPTTPSKRRKGDAGLWQRRFWEHWCRDEADVARCVRYCWVNPVKHGFVARPADWLWSSIHRDIRVGRVDAGWS